MRGSKNLKNDMLSQWRFAVRVFKFEWAGTFRLLMILVDQASQRMTSHHHCHQRKRTSFNPHCIPTSNSRRKRRGRRDRIWRWNLRARYTQTGRRCLHERDEQHSAHPDSEVSCQSPRQAIHTIRIETPPEQDDTITSRGSLNDHSKPIIAQQTHLLKTSVSA